MKFEQLYPDVSEKISIGSTYITKGPKLGTCRLCGAITRWMDVLGLFHACSEECLCQAPTEDDAVQQEIALAETARTVTKDILMVVHDQLDFVKQCIDSILATTDHFNLYIWDNGSAAETQAYLTDLMFRFNERLSLMRSEDNIGFIYPNNELAALGDGEFLILLNSDCKVFDGWDKAMTAQFDANPKLGAVGFGGGLLGPDGRGLAAANGSKIDYVSGWCFCMRRAVYQEFGLFDPHLQFAYCEDSDLSLRLKKKGYELYSLHSPLVYHAQNVTVRAVEKEGGIDLKRSFEENHAYFRKKWSSYLSNDRMLLTP